MIPLPPFPDDLNEFLSILSDTILYGVGPETSKGELLEYATSELISSDDPLERDILRAGIADRLGEWWMKDRMFGEIGPEPRRAKKIITLTLSFTDDIHPETNAFRVGALVGGAETLRPLRRDCEELLHAKIYPRIILDEEDPSEIFDQFAGGVMEAYAAGADEDAWVMLLSLRSISDFLAPKVRYTSVDWREQATMRRQEGLREIRRSEEAEFHHAMHGMLRHLRLPDERGIENEGSH